MHGDRVQSFDAALRSLDQRSQGPYRKSGGFVVGGYFNLLLELEVCCEHKSDWDAAFAGSGILHCLCPKRGDHCDRGFLLRLLVHVYSNSSFWPHANSLSPVIFGEELVLPFPCISFAIIPLCLSLAPYCAWVLCFG